MQLHDNSHHSILFSYDSTLQHFAYITLSSITLNITALSVTIKNTTLSTHNAEYSLCRVVFMLSMPMKPIMLGIIELGIIMLNIVSLRVASPITEPVYKIMFKDCGPILFLKITKVEPQM